MQLYVIRHGQTAWNADSRAQGHSDIPLDETGRLQAERLAESFAERPLERLLASDLLRCRETAEPLARLFGLAPEWTAALRERAFGTWEGCTFTEYDQWTTEALERLGCAETELRPPSGESFDDVRARIEPIVEALRREDRPTALVCHGGVGSVLLARLLECPLPAARSFRFSNTGVTELRRHPRGYYRIVRYNDTAHLAGEEAPLPVHLPAPSIRL